MGECGERHVGRVPCLLRYPLEFRGDGGGARCLVHLSLQQFRDPVPPFAPRGPSGRFPHFPARTAALRLPAARHASLRCLRAAFTAVSSTTEATGPPRFLGNPCARAPLSGPGGAAASGPSGGASQLTQWCCLPPLQRRRPPRQETFRGSITRPAHLLSTLRGHGYPCTDPRPRKTRFRLVVSLCRSGLSPAGCFVGFLSLHL